MTEQIDPETAQRIAREHLAAQAQAVTGTPSAGIYGDPAGAAQPAQPMDLSAAKRTEVDADELLAMLRKQQAQIEQMQAEREAERLAALPAPPEPPDLTPRVSGSAEIQHWLGVIHARLLLLEEKAGIDVADVLKRLTGV